MDKETPLNPSFTKPFGTHTFYQGGGIEPTSQLSQNRCPHERKILQGIRDIFESLRNVKAVYIMFTWLPQQLLKGEMFSGKITLFQPKIPIIQIASKFTIFKVTL